ncbi:probable serine/threonine-protein kinase DDB_G0267686 [Aplysia californica]|uniref:Probable serine/threonine-protein kinase DDB_G0267686 n=1 Tax=Aplysia californica TaxID=6500 RepID=A0ABM0JKK6_APLCA|nr:probable serine/threonine-protein kinase DDB_G0267686 [Aplysia californica]
MSHTLWSPRHTENDDMFSGRPLLLRMSRLACPFHSRLLISQAAFAMHERTHGHLDDVALTILLFDSLHQLLESVKRILHQLTSAFRGPAPACIERSCSSNKLPDLVTELSTCPMTHSSFVPDLLQLPPSTSRGGCVARRLSREQSPSRSHHDDLVPGGHKGSNRHYIHHYHHGTRRSSSTVNAGENGNEDDESNNNNDVNNNDGNNNYNDDNNNNISVNRPNVSSNNNINNVDIAINNNFLYIPNLSDSETRHFSNPAVQTLRQDSENNNASGSLDMPDSGANRPFAQVLSAESSPRADLSGAMATLQRVPLNPAFDLFGRDPVRGNLGTVNGLRENDFVLSESEEEGAEEEEELVIEVDQEVAKDIVLMLRSVGDALEARMRSQDQSSSLAVLGAFKLRLRDLVAIALPRHQAVQLLVGTSLSLAGLIQRL